MTVKPCAAHPTAPGIWNAMAELRLRHPSARGTYMRREWSEADCAVSVKYTLDSEDYKMMETSSFIIFMLIILYIEIIFWTY